MQSAFVTGLIEHLAEDDMTSSLRNDTAPLKPPTEGPHRMGFKPKR